MKYFIKILFVLFIMPAPVFCQTGQSNVLTQKKAGKNSSFDSGIFRKYYFQDQQVDPSVFENDSIVLLKKPENIISPRLELYKNPKFCFFFNVKLDTIKMIDNNTGGLITKISEVADKIYGEYWMVVAKISGKDSIDKNLHLVFPDGTVFNFDISDREGKSVLIKKP